MVQYGTWLGAQHCNCIDMGYCLWNRTMPWKQKGSGLTWQARGVTFMKGQMFQKKVLALLCLLFLPCMMPCSSAAYSLALLI